MKQDMFVIFDQGSEENAALARRVRALGCYSEIHPHDITAAELKALPGVKGVILAHGPNKLPDGSDPIPNADALALFPTLDAPCTDEALKRFIFDTCGASANWNTENFIADSVELLRQQIGKRKVLLALSGGVDSSVVAALLIRAVGDQLTCVHVNHGLLRKGEPEQVV